MVGIGEELCRRVSSDSTAKQGIVVSISVADHNLTLVETKVDVDYIYATTERRLEETDGGYGVEVPEVAAISSTTVRGEIEQRISTSICSPTGHDIITEPTTTHFLAVRRLCRSVTVLVSITRQRVSGEAVCGVRDKTATISTGGSKDGSRMRTG